MIFELLRENSLFVGAIVLYSLAAKNCYSLLEARRSPGATISWIWAHLTIPIFAVPLYWFIGRVRIHEYLASYEIDEELLHLNNKQISCWVQKYTSENLVEEYKKIFLQFGKTFAPSLNYVELLIDGESTFKSIFQSIESAKNYVFVQYYIIQSDRLGIELKNLLVKKANEGVKIYLLYDDMGSFWINRKYISDLIESGIKVERFLPVLNIKRPFLLNFRNHRKLVTVDGNVAFTGGLNVGEEYVGSRFRKFHPWRDTHVKLSGPAVASLEQIFFNDWNFASKIKVEDEVKDFRSLAKQEFLKKRTFQMDEGLIPTQVISSGPNDQRVLGMLLYMQFIHSASNRIWITTPYFIPDEAMQHALELAVLRGVDVRIIIPKESDHNLVHWAGLSYAEQLQKNGVKIFLYQKGFSHQKVVLIDDHISSVGTSNFDNRAMYLNFETSIIFFGGEMARKVRDMLETDMNSSKEFVPESDYIIRKFTSLRQNGARLLAPLL